MNFNRKNRDKHFASIHYIIEYINIYIITDLKGLKKYIYHATSALGFAFVIAVFELKEINMRKSTLIE